MMNTDVKAKWVAALRSGEYKQTARALRNNDSYCCLGVLCELSRLETGFGIGTNLEETGGEEFLGHTLKQWAGLPSGAGAVVTIDGRPTSLSEHNDAGKTFLQIADAIEAQL